MVNWILDLLFSPAGYMAMGAATGWLGRMIVVHLLSRVGNEFLRALLGRAWEEARLVLDDAYKAYTLQMMRAKADGTVVDEPSPFANTNWRTGFSAALTSDTPMLWNRVPFGRPNAISAKSFVSFSIAPL